jgi:hypothetical protein
MEITCMLESQDGNHLHLNLSASLACRTASHEAGY